MTDADDRPDMTPDEQPLAVEHGELVDIEAGDEDEPHGAVTEPAKVMRIGSMVKQLLEEVRNSSLDEASRERLAEVYERSVIELSGALSPDLQEELRSLALPFDHDDVPSEAELLAGGELLGHEARLDAVEQALEPTDELGLGDAQFGLAGNLVISEGKVQTFEFFDQLRGQAVLELLDRCLVDLGQALAGGLVQRRALHFVEQLLDHAADAHHFGRLLDLPGDTGAVVLG